MKETGPSFKLSHQQLTEILTDLLKIPKRNKLIHPCEERNHYSSVLQWLTAAMAGLLRTKNISAKQLNDKQQQLIHSTLGQMVQITRKECLQKSIILQIVQEYLIATVNAYCQLFANISREMNYDYEQNSVKMEKSYIEEIKRLQADVEEMRKDKEHRWRNMYMLIKDNRIYRKKNKKLLKSVELEMEKNVTLAEQMILIRAENEKLKVKIGCLDEEGVRIENYVETKLKLIELQKKIQKYPKRCKKILKDELQRIQINQINGLNNKIIFIIKAIEETGEIIDQLYDDDVVLTNFHYNISTQTDNPALQDRATNTIVIKMLHADCATTNRQHVSLDYDETVSVKIKAPKELKKEGGRESKNVMFMSGSFGNKLSMSMKKDDKLHRFTENNNRSLAICQSMRITIFQCRISYISTYNTEIFNGKQQRPKQSQQNVEQIKQQAKRDIKSVQTEEAEVQTEANGENERPHVVRSCMKNSSRISFLPNGSFDNRQDTRKGALRWQIDQVLSHCYNPAKLRQPRFHPHDKNEGQAFSKTQTNLSIRPSLCQNITEEKEQKLKHAELKPTKMVMYKQNESDMRFTFKRMTRRADTEKGEEEQEQEQEEYEEVIISQGKIVRIDMPKQQEMGVKDIQPTHSTKNTTKHQNENTTSSPTVLKDISKQLIQKPLSQTLNSSPLLNSKSPSKLSRKASTPAAFKNLQSLRLSKFTSSKQKSNHKRTSTEISEMPSELTSNDTINKNQGTNRTRLFKVKHLHRISEDLAEIQPILQQKIGQKGHTKKAEKIIKSLMQLKKTQKNISLLPFSLTRQGEFDLRQMDFSKGFERILRNMETRQNELLNNVYTLKTYLISYFKCLYGKEMYSSFVNFLINSPETQQVVICFNRMVNNKLPEAYLVDIFKTFVIAICNCFLNGESPLANTNNSQIMKSMVAMYYEKEQTQDFQDIMNNMQIGNLMGWFNCLEKELRTSALHSELYHFLSSILTETQDTVSAGFIEQLVFFIQNDSRLYQHLINASLFLPARTPIHRLCLFCKRHSWQKLINIQTTIKQQYAAKLGAYNEQEALKRIAVNLKIISEFKHIEKCLKYWIQSNKRYQQPLNPYLVMLVELNVFEYRLKNEMPLARDLKFISLAFEGLQKKIYYDSIKGLEQTRDKRKGAMNIRNSII